METSNVTVFILTHGRPDNVKTLATLKKSGYTGKIYFIVDNEDKSIDKYQKKFGSENIKIFDKKFYADKIDEADNFDNRKVITHARNACFDIAKDLGIKYFIQLDDDYTAFHFRWISKDGKKLEFKNVDNLNFVLNQYLNFYLSTNFKTIAFAQGGDFIGGAGNQNAQKMPLMRKCMNSFLCSTDRPFNFIGSMNEDVNTYCILGSRGELFGTIPLVNLVQTATQSNKSGATDWFKQNGTYLKSFYTVMMHPSSVKVAMMHSNHVRIHHQIKWSTTVPMIISEKYKKSTDELLMF